MSKIHIAESLKVFTAVVDNGSFAAAARELKLSPAWVAKTVAQLEKHLGVTLFLRSTRALSLTDAGTTCYHSAAKVNRELVELHELMRDSSSQVSGTIRMSMPVVLATEPMGAFIAKFQELHPKLELDIEVNDRFVDVQRDGFDVVLRLTHSLKDSTVIVRKLRQIRKVLCASPAYAGNSPRLDKIEDIQQHRCLVYTGLQTSNRWQFTEGNQTRYVVPPSCVKVNNSQLIRSALLAGSGVGLVPEIIVEDDLREGRLVQLSHLAEALPLSLFALRPPMRHMPLRTKLFWDFLVDSWRSA